MNYTLAVILLLSSLVHKCDALLKHSKNGLIDNLKGRQRMLDTCSLTGDVFIQRGDNLDGASIGGEAGRSVSISFHGTTVAIGAPLNANMGIKAGHVQVLEYSGGAWVQKGNVIEGELSGDQSGSSVSISADGSIVVIGAWCNDETGNASGHVRVFKYDGSAWNKQGDDIDGEAKNDRSGFSVSTSDDGSTVAIGAWGSDSVGNNSGHVRVFTFNGSAWNQKGTDIDGESGGDRSGYSVDINNDGSHVAVGATHSNDNGQNSGQVRVFAFENDEWVQLGEDIDGETIADRSGWSLSLSPDGFQIAVGAIHNDDNGSNSGHVRVFKYNGQKWVQLGDDINGAANDDKSGWSVSLANGGILAIGAPYNNNFNLSNSGHVRVLRWSDRNNRWDQVGDEIVGQSAGDWFGKSVSLSSDGKTLAVGAEHNDSNGISSGNVRVFDICEENDGSSGSKPNEEFVDTVAESFLIGSPNVEFKPFEHEVKVEQGIGINATNPDRPTNVFVILLKAGIDNDCAGPIDSTDNTVSVSGVSFSADNRFNEMTGTFDYVVKLNTTDWPSSDLLTYDDIDRSSGAILFCVEVVTEYNDVEITFQKTRFVLGFDLTDVTIRLGTLEIVELDPLVAKNDESLNFGVHACVCNLNLMCITTPVVNPQNADMMFCISSLSKNVEITNFGLVLVNQENNYKYTAVATGTDTWIAKLPTTVTVSGNVIIVTTIAVRGLFQDRNVGVLLEGVAELGFVGAPGQPLEPDDDCDTCSRSSTLHGFDVLVDVDVGEEENAGCIGNMLNGMKSFFKNKDYF